ncbi:MAG: hypothetical protein JW808_00230 [Victivallales bacterium]|nr:hypothetical protein [Victivallales bacterium]
MRMLILAVAGAFMLTAFVGCAFIEKLKHATKEATHAAKTGSTEYLMPFAVTLDGQSTVPKNAVCAGIANPVPNNAEIVVEASSGKMIIINAFPCDPDGNVANDAKAAIILIEEGKNKTTIDKTTDNKKLSAGNHIMNVVADNKTARVFFTVK